MELIIEKETLKGAPHNSPRNANEQASSLDDFYFLIPIGSFDIENPGPYMTTHTLS
jgi:hypothetical protein